MGHAVWWWVTHTGLQTWDSCNGWSREFTMAAQFLWHMTACFFVFFLHSVLSVLFPVFLMISAAAVRGVHRRQRPFHQVADGERPGPDHLLRHRGELQGGCKQDCMVFVSLLLLFSDYMLTEK